MSFAVPPLSSFPLVTPLILSVSSFMIVYGQAVRLLRSVSGLSIRPQDYVTSLGPCFATDNVDVIVAAMDTLSTVECDMQVNMYERRNQTLQNCP